MENNRSNGFHLFLLLAAGICIGLFINKTGGQLKKETPEAEFSKFDEVMWYVKQHYVDTVNSQQLED